jgi:hypothetical protein
MSHTKDNDLALAAWHVAQDRIIVARQRERIGRLKALGCDTLNHEQSLSVFIGTLKIFIDRERTIREGAFPGTRHAGS